MSTRPPLTRATHSDQAGLRVCLPRHLPAAAAPSLRFPAIAACFGMEVGPPSPMQLETEMPELSSVWERVVEKHGLKKIGMEELVGNSWRFTDINWLETTLLVSLLAADAAPSCT